jgi:DNA-binding NarL/FixJ family response regulator
VKRNVVLISNYGKNLTNQSATNEVKTDRGQSTFDILSLALHDIDLVIVDLGANMQSLAIVEALTHTKPAPRVIALVDGNNGEAMPELQRHGAAACLKKPFCADELARLIEVVCASTSREVSSSSDKWGHVSASSPRK